MYGMTNRFAATRAWSGLPRLSGRPAVHERSRSVSQCFPMSEVV